MKKSADLIRMRKGSICFTLLIVLFLTIVSAGLYIYSTHNAREVEREKDALEAFYFAEAGAERAINDLRQDLIIDGPDGWIDNDINVAKVFSSTSSFYDLYGTAATDTFIPIAQGGYMVQLKNVDGKDQEIEILSTGEAGGVRRSIHIYLRGKRIGIWDNAIFGGGGSVAGSVINGNVKVHGSVHVLGAGLNPGDTALSAGGGAVIAANNYRNMPGDLRNEVPALKITVVNGEKVETLEAELRVKQGLVDISGTSSAGEEDNPGDAFKETLDGAYVTDGYSGNKGSDEVYSDNGTDQGYDLGDALSFPGLDDPHPSGGTWIEFLEDNSVIISGDLTIKPQVKDTQQQGTNYIKMDEFGDMSVKGIVYVRGDLNFIKNASVDTINYKGTGVIVVEGNVNIGTDLVTTDFAQSSGNTIGIMARGNITVDAAQKDIMGLLYSEASVNIAKQTNLVGTIVADEFDMGLQVPSVFQVPGAIDCLPHMIKGVDVWKAEVVSWRRVPVP